MGALSAEELLDILEFFTTKGFTKDVGYRQLALLAFFVALRKPYKGSYRDIAKRVGLHRHCVKEALLQLSEDGFILNHTDKQGHLVVEVQQPHWLTQRLDHVLEPSAGTIASS